MNNQIYYQHPIIIRPIPVTKLPKEIHDYAVAMSFLFPSKIEYNKYINTKL